MNYKIIPTDNFNREVKKLAKKFRSIRNDLVQLRNDLQLKPTLGVHLGNNVYKIRVSIASKGRGKSGGARVISFVWVSDKKIFLMSVYDKSEKSNISDQEIKELLNQILHLIKRQ